MSAPAAVASNRSHRPSSIIGARSVMPTEVYIALIFGVAFELQNGNDNRDIIFQLALYLSIVLPHTANKVDE